MINKQSPGLSITEKCNELSLVRSTYYYQFSNESAKNLAIMRRIDELNLIYPTWGSRKMRDRLNLEDFGINRKRIQRLMRLMCLEAIYPKKKLSLRNKEHTVFPYLLRNLAIERPNQVWCTDITYIRLRHGFVYLVAVMDWYSRKILAWDLSISLDKSSCIWALDEALRQYGKPEIFNSDQGSQFTSPDFYGPLRKQGVEISMDGKGRALDNIVIERFWRTLKQDEVYLKDYLNVKDARKQIGVYIDSYNSFRPHENLGGKTPDMLYFKMPEKKVA
jgi:putative transposase